MKHSRKNKQKKKDHAKAQGRETAETLLREEKPAETLESKTVYEGRLFQVLQETVREPNGCVAERDIIRHNGSVVILAVDARKNDSGKGARESAKDPLIIMERQYRHAAGQFLWEIPAGRIEPGEDRLPAAQRELLEETGYTAERWTPLVRYYASPGFLGEWMQVFLAEGLTQGTATPEEDETLEIYPLRLSEVERLIIEGKVLDGKTLIALGAYRQMRTAAKRGKKKKHRGSKSR